MTEERIMAEFTEVLREEDLPPGRSLCVTVAGKDIALFNVDGSIYAMEDSCLHQGSSLAAGQLNGRIVTCRSHGWQYDVTTGNTVHVPDYGVGTFPVKVADGRIFVAAG
jgi:3-phenylpropionate/trans-cinnamate dioxygenase ferredoxin subunit